MNVFKLNLDDFDKWINRYEELVGEIDYISDSVKRVTFEQLNNEVWQGEDADLFRTGMIELADSSMPDFANHIRENIEIMKESSVEFKECKKFCEDFILAFDENAKICNSLDDMHGILYCDYDAVNASVELCKNIEEEKYFIERSIRKIKNDMQGLHYSQPEIEKCLCKFESDVSELSRIEQHHHDIIKYASMVRAADDRLASRLLDIVQPPGGDDDLQDLNDYLKEKYWFLYDYLVNKKGLSEEEAIDYLIYLRDEKKTLSSYWATYNYSWNDYKKLIENIDCDLWIRNQMSFLDGYLDGKGLDLSDNQKRELLTQYYNQYYEPIFTMPSAGMASYLDNMKCEIDFMIFDEILSNDDDMLALTLDEIEVYPYRAIGDENDIITDLLNDKYKKMLEERQMHPHNWFAYEYKDLEGLKSYYDTVGIPYKFENDSLIVNEQLKVSEENGYLKNQDGRYLITVGPLVIKPDYDAESSSLPISDFEQYLGCEIDVVLVNDKDPQDVITLKCTYGGDIKAHTDGWGQGICMSGIRYPLAESAGDRYASPDGSFVEFFAFPGPSDRKGMSNYSVQEIIVRQ